MKISKLLVCFAGVGLGLAVASCVSYSPYEGHCTNQTGDDFCREKYGDSKAFCQDGTCDPQIDDGCVAARPVDDACYSPCGGGKTLADDPDQECEGIADTGTDSMTLTSGPTEATSTDPTMTMTMSMTMSETADTTATQEPTEPTSTGPSGCVSHDECTDPAAPICEDMVCVACTEAGDGDAACEAKDASAPACREDGECVQCTPSNPSVCADETPVCDDGSSSCVGCTYHEQCAGSACRIATGACFEETEVYDVGAGQTYTTISAAVTDLGEGVQVVLLLHAGASFDEGVTLSGAETAYAFLSADGTVPQWVRTSGMGATLSVDNAAEAYVQNVRLTLNGFTGAAALEADGGRVYLDRAQVVNNGGGAVALTGNGFGQVRNSFVGGDESDIAAMNVVGSTATILYTTLGGGFGTAAALRCDGPSTVNVRNSLLVARTDDPELDCVADSVTTTITEADVSDMNTNWFGGYASGDFSLTVNAPVAILTAAQWNTGDPAVDIDGDARPNVDGTDDVAGADIP